MARRRRRIISKCVYEICFRAKNSLPFVAYRIIDEIIGASIARTQRDEKVILCHDIWNGSHAHLLVVALDSANLVHFYEEVQKKITDSLKKLLGLDYLNIWEGRPMVALIGDLNKAVVRISYFYANPAKDNLEDSIDRFPGMSSWRDFNYSLKELGAKTSKSYPWIRLPSIPKIPHAVISNSEDDRLVRHIRSRNKEKCKLIREPNAWMKSFGITNDAEASKHNLRIIERVRRLEQRARLRRMKLNKPLFGSARLRSQPILKPHRPKKRERKIFVMMSDKKKRIRHIRLNNQFCDECKWCYEQTLMGNYSVEWPAGAFRPRIPPNINLLPIAANL